MSPKIVSMVNVARTSTRSPSAPATSRSIPTPASVMPMILIATRPPRAARNVRPPGFSGPLLVWNDWMRSIVSWLSEPLSSNSRWTSSSARAAEEVAARPRAVRHVRRQAALDTGAEEREVDAPRQREREAPPRRDEAARAQAERSEAGPEAGADVPGVLAELAADQDHEAAAERDDAQDRDGSRERELEGRALPAGVDHHPAGHVEVEHRQQIGLDADARVEEEPGRGELRDRARIHRQRRPRGSAPAGSRDRR